MSTQPESSPQLPAEMLGVAFEDVMNGLSVELLLEEDDLDELVEKWKERHAEPVVVCVVPYDQYPMELIKAAGKMQDVLERVCFEFEKEGNISPATHEMAIRALKKAMGAE